MPRWTEKQRAVRALEKILSVREHNAAMRFLLSDDDPIEDDLDEYYVAELERVNSCRYYTRAAHYRRRTNRWECLLKNPIYLNDSEFLANFRVTRSAFKTLVKLVENDAVFMTKPRHRFRGGADLHLLILLKYLALSGNGNTSPNLALFFGLGKGSIDNYLARAVHAVLKLESVTITWPDEAERKSISKRVKKRFVFPNCVGVTDGTLFPLATKPQRNGEDYFTRKGGYAINALITCDDVARIRDIVIGWPGSVHDNRVWTNSTLHQKPNEFFRPNEYLLGDSAFQASSIMIPAFKKPPKAELDPERSYFNTRLAKIRIKSEHCIGLLKTRFQYLKGIRARLKTRAHMRKIIQLVTCACIFHNLLISEPVPAEWEKEIAQNGLSEKDELMLPVPPNAKGDERRQQLLAYLIEQRG